ncbi:hypothetical protein [Streptomyces sp. NPDC001930]|uniref:hypothetical protein n=1 Tax=Streptomyces sp. NPDC001930 TaxID=3364625 RepID=UPI0036923D55
MGRVVERLGTDTGCPGSVVVGLPRGTVLDAAGSVRGHGLTPVGREADAVTCHAGASPLDHTEIRAHGDVALHGGAGGSDGSGGSGASGGRRLITRSARGVG